MVAPAPQTAMTSAPAPVTTPAPVTPVQTTPTPTPDADARAAARRQAEAADDAEGPAQALLGGGFDESSRQRLRPVRMSAFGHVTGTVQRRHPASLVLFGLPLVAALLGVVLALAFGKPAADKPHAAAPLAATAGAVVSAGALRVTLPEGWTPARTGPKIPGFDGAHAAFARSYDSDVAIALLPARSPSLLPPALDVATNPASARPRIQRSGAVSAYDYVRPAKGQRVLDIVVVPTTLGVATIACSSAVVAPDECAQALHGLRLAGGSFLPLSTDVRLPGRPPRRGRDPRSAAPAPAHAPDAGGPRRRRGADRVPARRHLRDGRPRPAAARGAAQRGALDGDPAAPPALALLHARRRHPRPRPRRLQGGRTLDRDQRAAARGAHRGLAARAGAPASRRSAPARAALAGLERWARASTSAGTIAMAVNAIAHQYVCPKPLATAAGPRLPAWAS